MRRTTGRKRRARADENRHYNSLAAWFTAALWYTGASAKLVTGPANQRREIINDPGRCLCEEYGSSFA